MLQKQILKDFEVFVTGSREDNVRKNWSFLNGGLCGRSDWSFVISTKGPMGECESCEDALKIIPEHFIVKIQAGREYHTQTFTENGKYF